MTKRRSDDLFDTWLRLVWILAIQPALEMLREARNLLRAIYEAIRSSRSRRRHHGGRR